MIEDPPILTINRGFTRADETAIAALAGVPTSFVVDAMGGRGALPFDIKSLAPSPSSSMVGPALTCHCGPADNLALSAAVGMARPGDILVVGTDRFEGTCVTGDILVGMAHNRGVIGLVTDGLVRDVKGILESGLPVFCRGITPNSPVRNGPGTIGMRITIGAVSIDPGDVVVADAEGVVVVPKDMLPMVVERLPGITSNEEALCEDVRNGSDCPGEIQALLESDRVRYVD